MKKVLHFNLFKIEMRYYPILLLVGLALAYDKVLLKDVSSLILTREMTTGRRNSPVSQLICIG